MGRRGAELMEGYSREYVTVIIMFLDGPKKNTNTPTASCLHTFPLNSMYMLGHCFVVPVSPSTLCLRRSPPTQVKDSKKIRAGKGKMRNRRYVMRRGPLVIYEKSEVRLRFSSLFVPTAVVGGRSTVRLAVCRSVAFYLVYELDLATIGFLYWCPTVLLRVFFFFS